MMDLLETGRAAGLFAALILGIPSLVRAIVVIWSLRTDAEGRKHAIQILRVLKLWGKNKD